MKCPVCGSDDTKRTYEDTDDEYQAVREFECSQCQSTWKLFGEPIVEVIRVIWDEQASEIQYGPDIDLEAKETERIISEAKLRTIPMF